MGRLIADARPVSSWEALMLLEAGSRQDAMLVVPSPKRRAYIFSL